MHEAEALAVAPDTAVLALTRLFLADGRPAILATNVIPAELIAVAGEAYQGELPIHKFLREYCYQDIAYAVSDIEATLVTPALADILGREPGSALLKLIETFYNPDNRPLAFGVSYYDQTLLRLRMVQAWG